MTAPLLNRANIEPLFKNTFEFIEERMGNTPSVKSTIRSTLLAPIGSATVPCVTAIPGGLPQHEEIQKIVQFAELLFPSDTTSLFSVTLRKDAQKVLERAAHVAVLRNSPFKAPNMPREEKCESQPLISFLQVSDRIAYFLGTGNLDELKPDAIEFEKARELIETLSSQSPNLMGDLFGAMWNTYFDDAEREKALEFNDPDYCRHHFHRHPIAFFKAIQEIIESPILGNEYMHYRNCLLRMRGIEQFLNRDSDFTVNLDPESMESWLEEVLERLPQEMRNEVFGELYANLSDEDKAKAEGHPTYSEENYVVHIPELQKAIHKVVPQEILVAERSRLYLTTLDVIESLDFSKIVPIAVQKIQITRNLLRIVVMNAIERGFCHMVDDNYSVVKSLIKIELKDNPNAKTATVIEKVIFRMALYESFRECEEIYRIRLDQIELINLRNRLSHAVETHSYNGYSEVQIVQPGYTSKTVALSEWIAAARNKNGEPHFVRADLLDAKEILNKIGAYFGKETVDLLKGDFYNRVKTRATEQKDADLLQEMASDPDWATHHLEEKRFQDAINSCGLNLIDRCTLKELNKTSPAAKKLFQWLVDASGSKRNIDLRVGRVNSQVPGQPFLLDINSGAQVAMVELFLTQAFGV